MYERDKCVPPKGVVTKTWLLLWAIFTPKSNHVCRKTFLASDQLYVLYKPVVFCDTLATHGSCRFQSTWSRPTPGFALAGRRAFGASYRETRIAVRALLAGCCEG